MAHKFSEFSIFGNTQRDFERRGRKNYVGRRIIRGTIKMDGPDHLIGNASADVIDAEGKVIKNAFSAPWEATRMEIELPELQ